MNNLGHKPKLAGKKTSHRRAVIQTLMLELIRNERLQTTPSKAKILKAEFDRLVTEAKKDTIASKRNLHAKLHNDKAVVKLTEKLLPRLSDVNSGYTNTALTLPRKGDNAPQMVIMVRGAEVRERKSRLASALARRDANREKESKNTVAGRLKGAVSNVVPGASKESKGKKHESAADTRRVST